jgi:hypothetical protein
MPSASRPFLPTDDKKKKSSYTAFGLHFLRSFSRPFLLTDEEIQAARMRAPPTHVSTPTVSARRRCAKAAPHIGSVEYNTVVSAPHTSTYQRIRGMYQRMRIRIRMCVCVYAYYPHMHVCLRVRILSAYACVSACTYTIRIRMCVCVYV